MEPQINAMDEVARHNVERWRALADADALFTRPRLDLDPAAALALVDPEGLLGELSGKKVLCLAGGGGQQSPAFALLGAHVTVLDLSDAQLERDRQAAEHYATPIETIQGDMRNLSVLSPASFDLVYQPHSLGFVPDASVVFEQVARVLRPGGMYYFAVANPYFAGLTEDDWNGEGYVLKHPYQDGSMYSSSDSEWVYDRSRHPNQPPAPAQRVYQQTLSKLLNSLVGLGFSLIHYSDSKDFYPDPTAEGGTWDHFASIAPPWIALWLRYGGRSSGGRRPGWANRSPRSRLRCRTCTWRAIRPYTR